MYNVWAHHGYRAAGVESCLSLGEPMVPYILMVGRLSVGEERSAIEGKRRGWRMCSKPESRATGLVLVVT